MKTILTAEKAYDLARTRNFSVLRESFISPNFRWGEVFKNCSDEDIYQCQKLYFHNAVRHSVLMERVREEFKQPVIVHVWYRSTAHNKRVGGAEKSQHLLALAADFHIKGMDGLERNKMVQKRLDKCDFMAKAGLEFTGGAWTHVDSRSQADGKKFGYRFGA